jgi:hypothetical protein
VRQQRRAALAQIVIVLSNQITVQNVTLNYYDKGTYREAARFAPPGHGSAEIYPRRPN